MHRSSKRAFNCVPSDQALEQTINSETSSKGGDINFTVREGALFRWLLHDSVVMPILLSSLAVQVLTESCMRFSYKERQKCCEEHEGLPL